MDIYMYSDEAGVFDKWHNRYFVFGGILSLSKEDRDISARKYSKAENYVRESTQLCENQEVKASVIDNGQKASCSVRSITSTALAL